MLSRVAVRSAHSYGPLRQEQVTRLPSGLVVASAKHNRCHGFANLTLMYRAGSRYQTSEQLGLVRLVRAAMCNNRKRELPDGSFVNPILTHDCLGMYISVPWRSNLKKLALECAGKIAALEKWDSKIVLREGNSSKNSAPFSVLAAEYARRAAYGDGPLGYPIDPKVVVTDLKYTDEDVRHFTATHMVANNAVLYAINFDHDELCKFGEEYIPTSKVPTPRAPPSPYVGGEVEHKKQFESVYVCIAGAGAALEDVQACATQAVLMAWLGKQVARPDKNVLNQGRLVGVAKWFNTPSSVTCSAMYFEGEGLIQFNIEATPSCVRSMARDVVNILKNFKVDDFEISKNRAKHNILRAEDSRQARFAAVERTIQIFTGVEKDAVLKAIDNVTASQLEAAVERILSNISIGCIGNIDNVPYREEIQSWVK